MTHYTLENVLQESPLKSNIYVKDSGAISFKSPREYFEPFIESVSNLNPIFKVSTSNEIKNISEDNGEQVAYGRILVEAQLPPAYTLHGHDSVIGMVYALDVQKPIIKTYAGRNAHACTNLAVFNAKYYDEVSMFQAIAPIYDKVRTFSDTVEEQISVFKERYERMMNREYNIEELHKILGSILSECVMNKNIGTNVVLSATKDLYEPKSVYAIREGKTTEWNVYSAMTQYITDKVDIIDKATKTILIEELFDKIHNN